MTEKELLAAVYEEVIESKSNIADLSKQEITLLLKLANRVKKYKKDKEPGELKIAVLGSYSIQHFVSMLDAFLFGIGLNAEIYEGEYDGIQMDVLDPDSEFYRFKPQITILLMDDRDIKICPDYFCDGDEVDKLINNQIMYFNNLWNNIRSILPECQIIQSNIVVPPTRSLGNLEAGYAFSRSAYISRINIELSANHPSFVLIADMEYIASYVGKKLWFDYPSYFLTKAGFSPDVLGRVCGLFAQMISSLKGKVYKCLVLDLDNTLWGGVVGDDGYDGIQIDPHNAVGEAYRFFQRYVLELKSRGVILAVCSKNEEDIAKEPFEKNEHMLLKLSDIACFKANWEDKAGNIRKIAAELNIGIDSLVFIDDNPAEREIVKKYVPEVLVIDLPEDPALYALAIEESNAFTWTELTPEDIKRAESYSLNRERQQLLDNFVDYNEYLAALEMSARIGNPKGAQLQRFTQLINKSNQFNLRTQRYTESQIEAMQEDETTRLIFVDLKDKFSEYGIISCIILKKQGNECFIDTWLMSCRVLKRGVEQLAFEAVVKMATEMSCDTIIGEYIPTKKNRMVENFYTDLGFESLEDNRFKFNIKDFCKINSQIKLEV